VWRGCPIQIANAAALIAAVDSGDAQEINMTWDSLVEYGQELHESEERHHTHQQEGATP
jgi:hypothetical protein